MKLLLKDLKKYENYFLIAMNSKSEEFADPSENLEYNIIEENIPMEVFTNVK